jgi:hypothetical protein
MSVAFCAAHISGETLSIGIGSMVAWRAGEVVFEGRVTGIHPRPVVRRVDGRRLTRLGTPDDPAYEIEQTDGVRVLKLRSELEHTP